MIFIEFHGFPLIFLAWGRNRPHRHAYNHNGHALQGFREPAGAGFGDFLVISLIFGGFHQISCIFIEFQPFSTIPGSPVLPGEAPAPRH